MGSGDGPQAGCTHRRDVLGRCADDQPEGPPVTETPNPHIVDADTLSGEMRPIRRAVLALGSNLGERMASLQGAVDAIADTPDVWPPEAKTYLNAVVLIDTTLAATRLMDRALAIEDAFDRERSEVQNAPRTLDVDLIVVGDRRSDEESLRLPHPRAHERAFVLRPWLDADPTAELPDRGLVSELLDQADQSGIKVREDLVLEY